MYRPINYSDFYKTDHRPQYPDGSSLVYSNMTPRGSRIDGIDHVVAFAFQYFVKEFLIKRFNEGFFERSIDDAVSAYKRRLDNALGPDSVNVNHIGDLHDLGYLPLHIKALPEGTLCPMRVPVLTQYNTIPEFFWLTNFIETIESTTLWGPMTSATIAHRYREILDKFAELTSDTPEFVDFQGHDFSMRGMYGLEAATMSGAAHLLSFLGTDTIPAIDFLEKYYNANSDNIMIGGSISATEHSVMCMGGMDNEIETFRRLITEVYPTGLVSIVSDSWDFWKVITEFMPKLKNEIMARDGKVVIRPDSCKKTPVELICGDIEADTAWERKGAIQCLYDVFGGTTNSKGYMDLDPHIGLIYGDSITMSRAKRISQRLEQNRFASTNVVYGIGSYTYQHVTRDTFGFAIKATAGVVNGKSIDIFKDPKTDSGLKKSATGLLCVTEDMELIEKCTWEQEYTGMLQTIFKDGKLYNEQSLAEIRARLATQ
jgi:nicotinamide phosphoribosyltransferase